MKVVGKEMGPERRRTVEQIVKTIYCLARH